MKMPRKDFPLVLLALGMLLQTSPVPLRAYLLGAEGLSTASIRAGNVPIGPLISADLDRDGSPESLALAAGHLEILSAGKPVWQSPADWKVVHAAITDLNQDGLPEAALLVWRPFRAWPVDQWLPHGGRIAGFHDPAGNSCQIILIGWRGNGYGEVWAGSALAEPVQSFSAADLNGDGLQELVTLEGSYTDPPSAAAHALKVWQWNGFGFSNVSTVRASFNKMVLVRADSGQILILVTSQ